MTICPKCKAENRPEAAFCSLCGTILLAQTGQVKPFVDEPVLQETVSTEAAPPRPVEQSVFLPGFQRRMEGSIFGDRFKYDALIYQDEHETHYTVYELSQPSTPVVRVCSNPDCRTIQAPGEAGEEIFCTICGSAMDPTLPLLILEEADSDQFSSLEPVLDLHMAHPNIHPPLAIFQQEMPGGMRYCLVRPYSQELPSHPEPAQVLQWGQQLAEGLDYLHLHGVAFGEMLDTASFGVAEGKVVWRDFRNIRILPMLADREKINNLRQLALSLYAWITGKAAYSPDPALSPGLNDLFQRALIGEGFTSGAALSEQIEATVKAGFAPLNLDYQVGRRTDAGKKRSKNEDSLICFSLSRLVNGMSQPAGLFAIADGMGGHATGELASSLTVEAITQKAFAELVSLKILAPEEYIAWLRDAVQAANQAVYDARLKEGNDMGSTLVCALLLGCQAYIAHIGDSRFYLLRAGSIEQLTTDHSLVQHLVNIGQINSEDARNHPQRNVIYRSLGDKPQVDADVCTLNLLPDDLLLICSDGCTGMMDDQIIKNVIMHASCPQEACDKLVEDANQAGGEDNISVILVKVIAA